MVWKMYVSELYIHPLKSAAALRVESIDYEAGGPAHDRQWMLVDTKGKFLSQRNLPKMCFIHASIHDGHLALSAGNKSISSDILQIGEGTTVSIWKDQVRAADCGDVAADMLSEFLGKQCRLVQLAPDTHRLVDPEYAHAGETVSFADGFPSLLVSQASLDEFNSHLNDPVDMRRFRPNIVVSGSAPYAEDEWRTLNINGISFDLVKPCSRCIMPSINPDTADKEMRVNEALLKTRRRGRNTYFGQNAIHHGLGKIRVGDKVELVR